MHNVKFSIIVPFHNPKIFFQTFIEAVSELVKSHRDVELIMVSNKTDDGSCKKIKNYFKEYENVKVLTFDDFPSSYASRNYGVKMSAGDYIIFTDIDCIPDTKWLDTSIEKFRNGINFFSGSIELFYKDRTPNIYEIFDREFFLQQERYARLSTGATANLGVKKEIFDKVGGFKEVLSGGDRDFCIRVNKIYPSQFRHIREIKVLHPARSTHAEIESKIKRVSEGIGFLKKDKSFSSKLFAVLKNFVGIFIQPNQIKVLMKVHKMSELNFKNKISFSIISLYFGAKARLYIIRKIFS